MLGASRSWRLRDSPKLKAHLVVSFAGGSMRDSIRTHRLCNLDLPLGNEGPGNGCAQQVHPLIQCICPAHTCCMCYNSVCRGAMQSLAMDVHTPSSSVVAL